VTDYTRMALGTKVENGEISLCPYCHRPGLAQRQNNAIFIHSQRLQVEKDGQILAVWHTCPKKDISGLPSPPKDLRKLVP
jgi:hypothetical protein